MWKRLFEDFLRFFFASQKVDEAKEPLPAPKPVGVSQEIKKLCFAITSAFEGSPLGKIGFDNITGNFDGQGLSIGFLQFCTGQDSDRELFQKMYKRHPEVMKTCLGDLYEGFVESLSKSKAERLQWAVSINGPNNRIKEPWKSRLLALCRTSEFQSIQMEMAEGRIQSAIALCRDYGLKSIRALALMFDIVVQNGSIGKDAKGRIMARRESAKSERELLAIIVEERIKDSKPRFQADVKSRKMCIVNGRGVVHGESYHFDSIGLSDDPFSA